MYNLYLPSAMFIAQVLMGPSKQLKHLTYTAISEKRCQRKAKSHKQRLQGNMGNFQPMRAPYSTDIRWRVIWMKEVLGYEVN